MLSQSIPRVFTVPTDIHDSILSTTIGHTPAESSASLVPLANLQPELRTPSSVEGTSAWTSVDLFIAIGAVKLHLYDSQATSASNLKDHGIAKFALNDNSLKAKTLSDGALEAQVIMKSFTMSNTRPGNSKFREIIPAAQHDRNQLEVLYTVSGGADRSALAVATVESPHIIFAIEPVIALLEFFGSVAGQTPVQDPVTERDTSPTSPSSTSALAFRFDLHDASISILEDDSDSETQAIQLTVKQILLSQQVSSQLLRDRIELIEVLRAF